jgi:hypothetical protein
MPFRSPCYALKPSMVSPRELLIRMGKEGCVRFFLVTSSLNASFSRLVPNDLSVIQTLLFGCVWGGPLPGNSNSTKTLLVDWTFYLEVSKKSGEPLWIQKLPYSLKYEEPPINIFVIEKEKKLFSWSLKVKSQDPERWGDMLMMEDKSQIWDLLLWDLEIPVNTSAPARVLPFFPHFQLQNYSPIHFLTR